jgi:hypothetical protein
MATAAAPSEPADIRAKDITDALTESALLNAVHVEVTNDSYFYVMRRKLGGKRHMKMIAKLNPTTMRWESYIFRMKKGDEDYAPVPKKVYLSAHPTQWAAYKHCDASMKLRDANAAPGSERYNTHFLVKVVSTAFDRLNNIERTALVYSEILRSIGSNNKASNRLDLVAPTKMKLGSLFGHNVLQLPLFRFLWSETCAVTLMIDARTPSQWNAKSFAAPLSERLGPSHTEMRSGFLPEIVKPAAQKKAIKNIATAPTKLEAIGPPSSAARNGKGKKGKKAEKSPVATEDEAAAAVSAPDPSNEVFPDIDVEGADETDGEPVDREEAADGGGPPHDASAEEPLTNRSSQQSSRVSEGKPTARTAKRRKKTGGVFGHFFMDINPEIRALIMEGFKNNKKMIQAEGTKAPPKKNASEAEEDSHHPVTTLSKMKKKLESTEHMSAYDSGTHNEDEMLEMFNISVLRFDRAAIRLQRLWRIRTYHRAIRYLWRRHYAAITVQRVLRGHFGRIYARLLGKLKPIAASRIQDKYRRYRARVAMQAWLALVKKAVRILGPVVRKFATHCIKLWHLRLNKAAVVIQALMRRYLGALKFSRVKGFMYINNIALPAVVQIQRIYRGLRGRRAYQRHLESVLKKQVDIPCSIIIQRVFRGTRGRIKARRQRFLSNKAKVIQKYMRKYHIRRNAERRHQREVEKWAATMIQKIGRGSIDRERVRIKKKDKWYRTVFIPAIIRTQAVARRHLAHNWFIELRRRHRASTYIKQWYKRMLRRAEMMRKWRILQEEMRNRQVAQIQKIIRGKLARKLFHRMRIADHGRKVLASKVILKAWVSFRDARRFKKLYDEHMAKKRSLVIEKMEKARKQICEDLAEAKKDLAYSRRCVQLVETRLEEVDLFYVEAELRVAKVSKELDELTPEDVEHGWAESFGVEIEGLYNQMNMAKEERRLRIVQLKNAQREYVNISIEQEELEAELDAANVKEAENMEKIRLGEIMAVEKRLKDLKDRKIRIEKCRWKIKSNRRNIIERIRDEKLKQQVRHNVLRRAIFLSCRFLCSIFRPSWVVQLNMPCQLPSRLNKGATT